MIGYTLSNASALQSKLANLPKNLDKAVDRAFLKIGLLIERHAKFLTPVKTGRLRASIFTVVGRLQATVATNTDYAVYVHNQVPFLTAGAQEVIRSQEPNKIMIEEIEKALV